MRYSVLGSMDSRSALYASTASVDVSGGTRLGYIHQLKFDSCFTIGSACHDPDVRKRVRTCIHTMTYAVLIPPLAT